MQRWLETHRDRFYSLAQRYSTLLSEHYGPYPSESSLPVVARWDIKQDEIHNNDFPNPDLKEAEKSMNDARMDWQQTLGYIRQGPVLSRHPPRVSLPLEIIQYIVALAFSELDLRDFRHAERAKRGVASLLYPEHPAHAVLLALTTLPIDSCCHAQYSRWTDLDNPQFRLPCERLGIKITGIPSIGLIESEEWMLRFAQRYASNVRWLKTWNIHGLEKCAFLLPHLRYLSVFPDVTPKLAKTDSDFRWLAKEGEHLNLRSASIPSYLIETFASSRLLTNLVRLTIHFPSGVTLYPKVESFDEIMKMLPELKNLRFLSLWTHRSYKDDWDAPDLIPHSTDDIADRDSNGLCRRLPPLRQLRLDAPWKLSFPLLSELASPWLKELALWNTDGVDIQKLSEMFPRLEALAIPKPDVRKVLTRRDTPKNTTGRLWNFPYLHTLDLRGIMLLFTTDELSGLVEVIRLRTAAHHISPIGVTGPEAYVRPINRLYINLPSASHVVLHPTNFRVKKDNIDSQLALIFIELDKLVPNLILQQNR